MRVRFFIFLLLLAFAFASSSLFRRVANDSGKCNPLPCPTQVPFLVQEGPRLKSVRMQVISGTVTTTVLVRS